MRSESNLLQSILEANRRMSGRLGARLPHARERIHRQYEALVASHLRAGSDQVVVDIGAGCSCPFAVHRGGLDTKLIGVDVSDSEMRLNEDLDEKIVANAAEHLPFGDAEVDLIVSRSALEHFERLDTFVTEAFRVLKPGGTMIHVFPSKLAPFSILNRVFPRALTRRLLSRLVPGSEGILGFPAHYDHCTHDSMIRLLQRSGFEISESRVTYYQASYFNFFTPLYLLAVGYELAIWRADLKNLAAAVLVVARKPGSTATARMHDSERALTAHLHGPEGGDHATRRRFPGPDAREPAPRSPGPL